MVEGAVGEPGLGPTPLTLGWALPGLCCLPLCRPNLGLLVWPWSWALSASEAIVGTFFLAGW